MTRFQDGPAQGKTLMLRRAARFLRVTEKAGTFDALDQIDDTPEPGETLYAYEIIGGFGMAFIDGPKCRGRYAIATYGFVPDQPPQEAMLNIEAWHSWCFARKDTPAREA